MSYSTVLNKKMILIKKILFLISIVFVFNLYVSIALAIPPSPNSTCHQAGNCPTDPDHVSIGPSITKPGIVQTAAISIGKTIVIPVRFSDVTNSTTINQINSTVQNLRAYYAENSYSVAPVMDVSPQWYTLDFPMTDYGADDRNCPDFIDYGLEAGTGCIEPPRGSFEFAWDALVAVDTSIDFSNYDRVIIVHAGNDEASSNVDNDLWSVQQGGLNFWTNDGVTVNSVAIVSETDAVGIFAHEFAHLLGAPDFYDTSSPVGSPVAGSWDLMDDGSWGGTPSGSNPSHLSSWNKIQFGWITPYVVNPTSDMNFTSYVSQLSPLACQNITGYCPSPHGIKAIKVPIRSSNSQEYFLIENRQNTTGYYDRSLPESGILIWHVNDSIGSIQNNDINNGPIKRVIPENQFPSDVTLDRAAYNQGDQNFTPSTNPNSNMNNGMTSKVSVKNFFLNGDKHFSLYVENNKIITECPYTIIYPGNYTLGGDLSYPGPSGTGCILIYSNNVVLDCKGYSITGIYGRGDSTHQTYGIFVSGDGGKGQNDIVRNCVVNKFWAGIEYWYYTANGIIENNTLNSNFYGFYFNTATNHVIRNNLVQNNSAGMLFDHYAIHNLITNNTMMGNDGTGVTLGSGLNNVTNNTARLNGRGVSLPSDLNIVKDNIIDLNGVSGIVLTGTANTIYNNLLNNTVNDEFWPYVYTNYWNTTNQTGTRIYSPGTQIGGNYWTNPAGNGYSDTCNDTDTDGFCDISYVVNPTGPNIDYLPLSNKYPVDTTPPTYSSNSTNSTLAGTSIMHSLKWTDNVALSGYIFSFDNGTGTLVNDSWVAMTGTMNWSNVTKLVNPAIGTLIRWCVYANDTSNRWNSTSCVTPFRYTTSGPNFNISSCPYTITNPGNYVLNQSISTTGGTCISINSNNVTLDCQGYKLTGTNSGDGIHIYGTSGKVIKNCIITNFNYGISVDSSSNILINNTANSNAAEGIGLTYSSSNNILINNTANSNSDVGILVWISSTNNTLINNTANSNNAGIYLYSSSNNNTLIGNTANSNHLDGIYLYSSSNNNITNNTANSNTINGILLDHSSSNNIFTGNTLNSNIYGIGLWSSSNNNITNNTANSNHFGIYLYSSSNNNSIYNNYLSNPVNAADTGNNFWNTTKTLGTNIIGGPYIGGNYWSDYNGYDTNGDGIGDTDLPYNSGGNIANGGDYLPLLIPDTTLPTITILSPLNITYYTTSIPLTFTVSEPASWCGYSLDGGANVTLASCANTILTSLGYSSHDVIVYANDTSGNMGKSDKVYFTVNVSHACGDGIWEDGEWCGHDCLITTGSTDMNHDCVVDTLDYILITKHFGSTNYSSGDLNGDGKVDIIDIAIFGRHYGDFITYCTDAGQYFIDKKGSLSISFSNDTSNIINSITVSVNSTINAYIIASDVQNLTSLEFGLLSSPNLNFSRFSVSPSLALVIGNEGRIEVIKQSWQQPVSGSAVIGWATYNVTGTGNGNISIIKNSHFGKLEWSKSPEELYRANFANIFNATITPSVPIISILSPKNNFNYSTSYIPLNFTIDGNTSWIGYSLNRTANITITGNKTLPGLTSKWNNVTVYANDTSGNMGVSDTVNFFYCLADINHDNYVNAKDAVIIGTAFGSSCNENSCSSGYSCWGNSTGCTQKSVKWNGDADLNLDNWINAKDSVILGSNFGKSCI